METSQTKIMIIGSRKCTSYGLEVIRDLIGKLSSRGFIVIASFGTEVEREALTTSLISGGRSISYLGYGRSLLKKDKKTSDLIKRLLRDKNRVILGFKNNTQPSIKTYKIINQRMLEICDCILITEALIGSGAIVLAQEAMEQEKVVYAVPGSIFSYSSTGTNHLIQMGAKMVCNSNDILPIT